MTLTLKRYRQLQAIILLGTGLFLISKIWGGTLYWYIAERYTGLVLAAALGLAALAVMMLNTLNKQATTDEPPLFDPTNMDDHTKPSWANIVMVALPLLFGILIPAKPLSASAVTNKTVNTVNSTGDSALLRSEQPSTSRSILDWIVLVNYTESPGDYAGQEAEVSGFVFNDPRLAENEVLLGRFTLTCCAADSSAVAMVIQLPEGQTYEDNQWLQVSGPVTIGELDGGPMPVLAAESVEVITAPDNPYLYP